MPRGLPQSGDRGLDYTPTWGRTYWGGALFCLLADIRIREQTDGRKTLRDALRGIVDAGYDITRRSDLREVLTIADRATGVRVLTGLYDEMRDRPGIDDLDALWRSLGVSERSQSVVFDEQAPLGEIRRALTASDL
jgi:predicted metalloprotease with PDZ domain